MMKKMFALMGLAFVASGALAQENKVKTNYPYWTISKDIQRMRFKNAEFIPATIVTGTSLPISKGIHLLNTTPSQPTLVKTTGMPSSVISKGIARMQYERNKRK